MQGLGADVNTDGMGIANAGGKEDGPPDIDADPDANAAAHASVTENANQNGNPDCNVKDHLNPNRKASHC